MIAPRDQKYQSNFVEVRFSPPFSLLSALGQSFLRSLLSPEDAETLVNCAAAS